jgi:hypothetical protein
LLLAALAAFGEHEGTDASTIESESGAGGVDKRMCVARRFGA